MTLEDALDYCRVNNFTIAFVGGKGPQARYHVTTPCWYAELSVPFTRLIEYVKERWEAEQVALKELEKEYEKKYAHMDKADRPYPRYEEVMKKAQSYEITNKYKNNF